MAILADVGSPLAGVVWPRASSLAYG